MGFFFIRVAAGGRVAWSVGEKSLLEKKSWCFAGKVLKTYTSFGRD